MKTMTPTARDLRANLSALRVTGPAADLLVKLTAKERHEARVAAVMAACDVEYLKAPACAIVFHCVLDIIGVGGPQGVGGCGTERHPLWQRLGAATKQSGAGPAWTAAIEEGRLRAELCAGPLLVRLHRSEDTILVLAELGGVRDQVWSTEVLTGDDSESINPDWPSSYRRTRRWIAALAGVAIARLSGVYPEFRADVPVVFCDDDLPLWSEIYAACVSPSYG